MFYGQCWKCGERWELGTASTCKCPEEPSIDWKDYSIPVNKMPALSIGNIKPNYNMTFHRDGKQIGELDFNGPEMTFTGDADESAKLFFDLIARSFKERLEQERADEREKCEGVAAQAAREAIVFAMDAEREACANLVFHSPPSDEYESPLRAVYNAIRARSST